MVLVIDNYDSFTWNLVDLLRRGTDSVKVVRNDAISLSDIESLNPKGILISPGPGRPEDSGISIDVVRSLAGKIPILGVCLGHQLLGEMFGMEVVHAQAPMHGKTSWVDHDGNGIFKGIPSPMRVMRYHSLLLRNQILPKGLTTTAKTATGEIMGIRHKLLNFAGVQFHPESILTDHGNRILSNWLRNL